jgi:hypothetical protein
VQQPFTAHLTSVTERPAYTGVVTFGCIYRDYLTTQVSASPTDLPMVMASGTVRTTASFCQRFRGFDPVPATMLGGSRMPGA